MASGPARLHGFKRTLRRTKRRRLSARLARLSLNADVRYKKEIDQLGRRSGSESHPPAHGFTSTLRLVRLITNFLPSGALKRCFK